MGFRLLRTATDGPVFKAGEMVIDWEFEPR